MRAALALECKIASTSIFARKNYFYPDLPKGYQISQYAYPLAQNGRILIRTDKGERYIRIHRAHLEEDTGKLTHINEDGEIYSLVNLNRAGVPLLEIVSEPDMHTVEDVAAYSRELRLILRRLDVSSGDMEKGTMRFEANLSMRPPGQKELGTRVEVKNLNSFRSMENAILYQMEIQKQTLSAGKEVQQQTLGWDENSGSTFSQRSKENANDYRYFPEPDLPPLIISEDWISRVLHALPELPNKKRSRYAESFQLQTEDIERLIEDKESSDFFEECILAAPSLSPGVIVNWLLTDLFAWTNKNNVTLSDIRINSEQFTKLIHLVQAGDINQNTGKDVLREMLENGKSAWEIVKEKNLGQISNSHQIGEIIEEVLKKNNSAVQEYLNGKETIQNWLFGQVMGAAKGKANPKIVKHILQEKLKQKR